MLKPLKLRSKTRKIVTCNKVVIELGLEDGNFVVKSEDIRVNLEKVKISLCGVALDVSATIDAELTIGTVKIDKFHVGKFKIKVPLGDIEHSIPETVIVDVDGTSICSNKDQPFDLSVSKLQVQGMEAKVGEVDIETGELWIWLKKLQEADVKKVADKARFQMSVVVDLVFTPKQYRKVVRECIKDLSIKIRNQAYLPYNIITTAIGSPRIDLTIKEGAKLNLEANGMTVGSKEQPITFKMGDESAEPVVAQILRSMRIPIAEVKDREFKHCNGETKMTLTITHHVSVSVRNIRMSVGNVSGSTQGITLTNLNAKLKEGTLSVQDTRLTAEGGWIDLDPHE